MATHRVVTKTQRPDGWLWQWGELINYSGEPDWKFEPIDPVAREVWERETARPDWAEELNQRDTISGCFRENEDVLPAGGAPRNMLTGYVGARNDGMPAGTLPAGWGQPLNGRA